ncbi:uncharacterized protein [Mytilus edulis]|uniref:uncharacterized protein n=1 Tax=Mytilus edulis TaxID=6550 RepID=UPI0039F0FD43
MDILTNQFLYDLANKMPSDYHQILINLGLEEYKIEQNEHDYRYVRQKAFAGLLQWQRKMDNQKKTDMIECLKSALAKVNRNDLQQELVNREKCIDEDFENCNENNVSDFQTIGTDGEKQLLNIDNSEHMEVNEWHNAHANIKKVNGIIDEENPNDENQPPNSTRHRSLTKHPTKRLKLQKPDDEGIQHNHSKQKSRPKNIHSISNMKHEKHQEIARGILCNRSDNSYVTQSEQLQSSQTKCTMTMGHQVIQTETTEGQHKIGQDHVFPSIPGLSCIFGAPIYGGTINININNTLPPVRRQKKRRFVIESDSSQED